MADVIPISEKLRDTREALLQRHLVAHNEGDVDGVLATFTRPRIELIASGRVLEGTTAVRAYLEDRRRSFPDQRFEVICHHHSDDVVVSEHWMTGTHLGDLHGVEPTGRRFRARMAAIFEFEGPDLVNQRLYYDAGTVARQLA
ncbi:ester cyclase [Actinospongicola halichondriae]|uniref:ester cyclase n=1 Tax=Actinospongicola halichondriae TaxID=3236844 RepID=UPI003D4D87AA